MESYGRWVKMIDGMSPGVDANKTVMPEQDRESTSFSTGVNPQKQTSTLSKGFRSEKSKLLLLVSLWLSKSLVF
jgi:hypothetical protein